MVLHGKWDFGTLDPKLKGFSSQFREEIRELHPCSAKKGNADGFVWQGFGGEGLRGWQ